MRVFFLSYQNGKYFTSCQCVHVDPDTSLTADFKPSPYLGVGKRCLPQGSNKGCFPKGSCRGLSMCGFQRGKYSAPGSIQDPLLVLLCFA